MIEGIVGSRWRLPIAAVSAALIFAPLVVPAFWVYILPLIFVTALLAISLNLVLGYGGIYQFHHGVFYGVGAYTAALILTRTSLPAWVGFSAGPLLAAASGLLIGWFCVRLTKLYFGMLQISLGSLIWIIVSRAYSITGGDNGIHDVPVPALLRTSNGVYYFTLVILIVCLAVMYLIVKSPFGCTLQAIRDNPQRCEAVGIDVRRHQLMAIGLAALFAGVAGVLFVGLERSVFPDLLFWVLSLEILVMCLLGGWFTFTGPIVGAAVVVSLRTFVSIYTDYWTLVLGVILILLIFFLPEGVMGFLLERLEPRPIEEGRRRVDVAG
ncbi:MAG: branched-chain amino acid ABC transporter permease [Chloroflexi bacterium]|nr:branched-chain amino acid ABC transporter permease [Chloroflexota bacterium]